MTEALLAATMMENAVQLLAEIEAMKQENRDREAQGEAPAYSEGHFRSAAHYWKTQTQPEQI